MNRSDIQRRGCGVCVEIEAVWVLEQIFDGEGNIGRKGVGVGIVGG